MNDRPFDVVVFGATGFTGGLVAEYLAEKARGGVFRWALAGRSKAKLEDVLQRVRAIDPEAQPGLLEARSDDDASLERMAASCRVVLTTVGPYALHGEPLVAACIRAGTDYVDITGEPEFVNGLLHRHDAAARERGVRIVSCCGFDSIPHDLGAFFTVQKLGPAEPIVMEGLVRATGTFSGGTWQSAIGAMSRPKGLGGQREAEPTGTRRARRLKKGVHYEPRLRAWAAPLPTIDPQIVLRSARALEAYGPDFQYGHYVAIRSTLGLALGALGVGAVVALAQLGPTRELLLRVRKSGEGPSAQQRAKGRFQVTFVAKTPTKTLVTRVSGGDPGYTETAKMVSESALCLAQDRATLPAQAGVLTPAVALGDALLARLVKAGIRFEVLEE